MIHKKNFIHADIKIQNILITKPTKQDKENGLTARAKICDFGISQMIREEKFETRPKAIMKEKSGTMGYMAPEILGQSKNIIVGPEIDMWAFGIVLYEICVAYKPV
jgi:serine/threonine protein kinase